MSSPMIPFLAIVLTSSLLLIDARSSSPHYPLIERACSKAEINIVDTEACLAALKSVPAIVAAKDLFNLMLAIIEAGISNATSTLRHVEHVLRGTKNVASRGAWKECKFWYGQVVERFQSSLDDVKIKSYVAPTYYLLTASTDCVKSCNEAMQSRNLTDDVVSKGSRFVPLFGLSAFSAIADLQRLGSPPPSSTDLVY